MKATTAYLTMMCTELISAPASWTQWFFFQIFCSSRFAISISWTLHRRTICIKIKYTVQEIRPNFIHNHFFGTMQWLTRDKFVNKANETCMKQLTRSEGLLHCQPKTHAQSEADTSTINYTGARRLDNTEIVRILQLLSA